MRITSKGQVTIPADIRAKAGLLPNTEVVWGMEGQAVTIRAAAKTKKKTRGELIVEALMRGKKKSIGMTTDEIMALMRPR